MTTTWFIHIGTHKTGTTSLQAFLTSNEDTLAHSGIYVPKTGRPWPGSGHHNIAWELNGDPRFNTAFGTLAEMVAEVSSVRPASVCISSEDFEYVYANSECLRRLDEQISSIGYQAKIVIYLRPQADYAESLYAELVKHGLARPFPDFLDSILQQGAVTFRDIWRFVFDYNVLIEPFLAAFGPKRVVVRPYPSGRAPGCLVEDFASAIGLNSKSEINFGDFDHKNTSIPFNKVVELFLLNNFADKASGFVVDYSKILNPTTVGHAQGYLYGRFDPVHLAHVIRIWRRFKGANDRLAAKCGIGIPCVSGHQLLRVIRAAFWLDEDSNRRQHLLSSLCR